MNARDIFGLAIRVVGLLLSVLSMLYFLPVLCQLNGLDDATPNVKAYWIYGAVTAFVALYFLSGAPHLMKFSYPPENEGRQQDQSEPGSSG